MKRSTSLITGLITAFVAWIVTLWVVPLTDDQRFAVRALPYLSLIALASYSLLLIGYNLIIFRDTPEASKELEQEIVNVRNSLRARGFKFDSDK